MSKKNATPPAPPAKPQHDPEVASPEPTVKVGRLVRFVYIPVEGFYAGNATRWFKNDADSLEWSALRKNNRLTGFLTNNPLSIVYADLDPITLDFKVSQISVGGTFLKEAVAKSILPFLPWVAEDVKKPVVATEEEK